jgi:DNA-binding MarR family transcriptional regulator
METNEELSLAPPCSWNLVGAPPRTHSPATASYRTVTWYGTRQIRNILTIVSIETIIVSVETNMARPKISSLETHLGYWLRKVSNSVSGGFAQSLQARRTSVAEWVLLRHLWDATQATPAEMAEALTMTRGAISKIIDKLESKGWIRSKINPDDHRGQLLSLTGAGRRIVPELAHIADQNDQKFFSCLESEEKTALHRLLAKIAAHHQLHDVPFE